MQAIGILLSALFTIAVVTIPGVLLVRHLRFKCFGIEETALGFLLGSACLSSIVFTLASVRLAREAVFIAIGAAVIITGIWRKVYRCPQALSPPPRFWTYIGTCIAVPFSLLYVVNALAPEVSPDGSAYHLGLVARYLRAGGFERITTNMYASLSQGVHMVYLFAFAFGKHSAAAVVHLAFLLVLACLMVQYGRRFGFEAAGIVGALLLFVCPVIGADGTAAYVDVALAAVVFGVFYLLEIWDTTGGRNLLVAAGILAGFGFAVKYTAALMIVYAAAFVLIRARRHGEGCWQSAGIIALSAACVAAPWLIKNAIFVSNPVAPFFNAWFPNPYIHIGLEQQYHHAMQHFGGITSYWSLPLELTVRGGALQGLAGPVFLLAPLGLLAARRPAGRRLIAVTMCLLLGYPANIGTRFLIPALPFLFLLIAMVITKSRAVAVLVLVIHAFASWPTVVNMYATGYAWRIRDFPIRAALRIQSEEEFLKARLSTMYDVLELIESKVPQREKVLALNGVPDAYTSREVLAGYVSAFNNTARDVLWSACIPGFQPARQLTLSFAPSTVDAIRIVQLGRHKSDYWSISELRFRNEGGELTRHPSWKINAKPNPWEVALAFDNNPATRWRSWEPLTPGMRVEVRFGNLRRIDAIQLDISPDQPTSRLQVLGQSQGGPWTSIPTTETEREVVISPQFGAMAIRELYMWGIRYLLIFDYDIGAPELTANAGFWGLETIGRAGPATLYRLR